MNQRVEKMAQMTDIAEWTQRTKRRHELCLNWESDGAVALALSVPTGLQRDWTRWFQEPEVIFDYEMALLEKRLATQSDIVPVLFPNFTAAVVVSLLGAEILFHENGPVYEPVIRDWAQLKELAVPDPRGGMMPQIEKTIDYFRDRAPGYAEIIPPYIHTPLNSAALLRGPSDFYADLCLHPDEAHQLLSLVTQTAAVAAQHIFDYLGRSAIPFTNQTGIYLGNQVHISDDCCVNLSPGFIKEFDLDYVSELSRLLGVPFCTHYCVMPPNDMADHCLEPTCVCEATLSLYNQYSVDYFLDHYSQFENRLALISLGGIRGGYTGKTRAERCRNFRSWAKGFLERFKGKSGLIIQAGAPSVEEAREMFEIWESLNTWPE